MVNLDCEIFDLKNIKVLELLVFLKYFYIFFKVLFLLIYLFNFVIYFLVVRFLFFFGFLELFISFLES